MFGFVSVDGGTAWMQRESVLLDIDSVDAGSSVEPWLDLAQQLKEDLTSIILMSEADLQVLPYFYASPRLHFRFKNASKSRKQNFINNHLVVPIKIF